MRTRLHQYTTLQVGSFKGLIRVLEAEPTVKDTNDDTGINFAEVQEPKPFMVRFYALKATGLQPKDRNGLADPYLVVKLGGRKINDRKKHASKTLTPSFHRLFEFETTIPGPSTLEIAIWDHDLIGRDELIGRTMIDLEDRWFHEEWQKIGKDNPLVNN